MPPCASPAILYTYAAECKQWHTLLSTLVQLNANTPYLWFMPMCPPPGSHNHTSRVHTNAAVCIHGPYPPPPLVDADAADIELGELCHSREGGQHLGRDAGEGETPQSRQRREGGKVAARGRRMRVKLLRPVSTEREAKLLRGGDRGVT